MYTIAAPMRRSVLAAVLATLLLGLSGPAAQAGGRVDATLPELAPVQREKFLGYAQILQVFEVKKIGKVAGCRITEGVVKRGCGVRLLRDGVVIHQGELGTLRRFKDDVKEVTSGYECGMNFTNYNDIRVGDQIECYETETVAAEL